MKEGQKEIFYLTGESREQVAASPHLEAFRDKGYEVLYLVDPVDELLVQYLTEYEGKRLKSVGKGTVDLGMRGDEKEESARRSSRRRRRSTRASPSGSRRSSTRTSSTCACPPA